MKFEDYIKSLNLKEVKNTKIEPDEFIKMFKEKKAILLDIREDLEREAVRFPFAIEIPLEKLPENLEKLPKDKIIACACPGGYRSLFATAYLRSIGFNAKNIIGGLSELFKEHLSGSKVKEIL
ncbi:rhodanese-like domain-containing protein [Caminibacter sp.]